MKQFMNYDFNIEKIVLSCFLLGGTGKVFHKNRPSHGLALHLEGEKKYSFSSGQKIVVKQNEIIYIPKGSTYSVEVISPGNCYAINFDIPENTGFSPFVFSCKNAERFTEHFKNAQKSWQKRKPGYLLKCKAELYNILYYMQNEHSYSYQPKSKFEIIRPAIEYIRSNYLKGTISINSLAKMCGTTPEYFRKIFKEFYGVSPISYINSLRLLHAKELIESGLSSITSAAEATGFSDISHFSREFKKAFGVSPREYKNQTTLL